MALEAGWVVTEVGRQPWVIHGVMRTSEAVTPAAGVPAMFFAFTLLYLVLGTTVVLLLWKLRSTDPEAIRAPQEVPVAVARSADGRLDRRLEAPMTHEALVDLAAGMALVGLMAYAVLGGADFGGGVWDLFATGPRRRGAARGDRPRHGAGLGGEPRLADLRDRRAVHLLPVRLRAARDRAVPPVPPGAGGDHAPRGGVRLPRPTAAAGAGTPRATAGVPVGDRLRDRVA